MTGMEIAGLAFGSGTLGAGLMKIIDTCVAYRLKKKEHASRKELVDAEQMQLDVRSCMGRLAALEEDCARRDKIEQATLKALNALLAHAITGNATGEMTRAQEKLVAAIVDNS